VTGADQFIPPGYQRNMLVVTTLLISVMATVDMSIVTVALPYMAGNLSATPDEITWVVTGFTVGQAIIIGITGHVSRLLGRKRLALVAVVGFVASSLACGLSTSLDQIVVFRFIQGLFSGPLIPISQSILIDAVPREERGRMLSIWAMGVIGGPAIGPALGGYLAETLDWRWNFWINLPVGVLTVVLILRFIRPVAAQRVTTDWVGLLLLTLFLVSLQVALDQGNRLDWLSSREIVLLGIVAIGSFIAFVGRGILIGPENVIRLSLLADLNFTVCTLLIAIMGSAFLGVLVLSPQIFIDFLGWEVLTAGLVIGCYGLAAVLGSLLSSHLARWLGARTVIVTGCFILALGWYLFSRINLNTGPAQAAVPGMMIEFGLLLAFPLVTAQAFSSIRPELHDEAAGLFNLMKTLGFSGGVTLISTLVYRGTQANWARYAGHLNPAQPGYYHFLGRVDYGDATPAAGALMSQILGTQAGFLAIIQAMEIMVALALCALPLALFMKVPRAAATPGEAHGAPVRR
jgi:DHA2 family multidrug resistance protein